ncbi:MASE1 domain-containing protein [Streptomyces sp. NPDC058045]|uniref:MASE1 domain-containing protein n=1 Tax=Streptomyces sp. NPDC058045 TaxID=3346311 RepID=UPI0036E605BE
MLPTLRRPRSELRSTLLLIVAVALCYWAAGRLGLLLRMTVEGAVVTPLWPPTGVAVAALLRYGARIWPGIALGTILVVSTLTGLDLNAVGIVVGNTVAPVVAWLMLRAAGFRTDISRLRDGLILVFLGAAGMIVSAACGVATLVLDGSLSAGDIWPVWASWWVGDAMGVLLVTPVLLLLSRLRSSDLAGHLVESVVLVAALGALTYGITHTVLSLLFLDFPLLIWGALRLPPAITALCALLISALATVAAVDSAGPFSGLTQFAVMLNLQAFNVSVALTSLLLSAVIAEQRRTRLRIEQVCRELVEVVETLAPPDTPRPRPPHELPPDPADGASA